MRPYLIAAMEERIVQPKPETISFILDYSGGAPQRQLATSDALDGKGVQVFGAASVVLGLGGLGSASQDSRVASALLLAAVIAYAVASAAAFRLLWTRRFRVTDDVNELYRNHSTNGLATVKHSITADAATAFDANGKLLAGKAKTLRWLLAAASVEVTLVTLALAWAAAP